MAPLLQLSKVEPFVDIKWILLCKLRQALLEMWVEWTRIYEQLASQDVLSESVFWDHSSDSVLKHIFRPFFKHMLQRGRLEVSHVPGILVINFLLLLTPCHVLIRCIYYDTVVAMLSRLSCSIVWLVLSSEIISTKCGYATERHSSCVKQVPCFALKLHRTIHRLWRVLGLFVDQGTVS